MFYQSLFIVSIIVGVFTSCQLKANTEISRTAPKEVSENVLPQLSNYKKLISLKDPFIDADEIGTTVLRERVHWVNKDGRRFRVFHNIYKARTEQAIDQLAESRYTFDALLTKVHLVKARTILPDGTIKDLAKNAAFLEQGKSDHNSQLYNSNKTLVIVFPDTQIGAYTESIVVYEDIAPREGAEYSSMVNWHLGWPIMKDIFILDLPNEMHKRLKFEHVGCPRIPLTVEQIGERTRSTWQKEEVHSPSWENYRAPTHLVGPATILSTNKDWNTVAKWYQNLLTPKSKLSPELKEQVDSWTKGMSKSEEIIERLYDHATNDIRYTGLEFGHAGLQPYDCNLVWKNQYGDCKDKSNLLCAMLRHKGIEAFVALINTEHDGTIHLDFPSYKNFNHAIVAIKQKDTNQKTKWLFCDPTIRFGKVGHLSTSSSERNVLIIKEGEAVWAKTPLITAGTLDYKFELKLSEESQLSGWLTITATENYAIWQAIDHQGLSKKVAIRRLNNIISPYFTGAKVIDYVAPNIKNKKIPDELKIKAFFTCPIPQNNNSDQISFSFPKSNSLFHDYGTNEKRSTSYHQLIETITVRANIETGATWTPNNLPTPYLANTPHCELSAYWQYDSDKKICTSNLKIKTLISLIPHDKIAQAQRANRSLFTWFETPLTLKKRSHADQLEVAEHTPIKMPLMPSGEGQLDLVNEWYPEEGDSKKRKLALEQIIQLFPEDLNTIFLARTYIADLSLNNEKYKDAQKQFETITSSNRPKIDPHNMAFAQYLLAITYQKQKLNIKAIKLLRKIISTEHISTFRRGWSYNLLLKSLINENRFDEVIKEGKQALKIEGEHRVYCISNVFTAYCHQKKSALAAEFLNTQLANIPDQTDAIINTIAGEIEGNTDDDFHEIFITTLEKSASSQEGETKILLNNNIKKLNRSKSLTQNYAAVHTKLLLLLKKHNRPYLDATLAKDAPDTREDLEKHLEAIDDIHHNQWLACVTKYFEKFEPDDQFSYYVWRLCSYIKWKESQTKGNTDFLEELFIESSKLSTLDNHYWEIQFLIASWHEENTNWQKALDTYETMENHPDLPNDFTRSLWRDLGRAQEQLQQWDKAIIFHLKNTKDIHNDPIACHYIVRAGHIYLRLGKVDSAFETWELLKDVDSSTWAEEEELSSDIEEALDFIQNKEQAQSYWKSSAIWWEKTFLPLWQEIGYQSHQSPPLYLNDNHEILKRYNIALKAKNIENLSTEFFTIAYAARYQPSKFSYFSEVTLKFTNHIPEHKTAIYNSVSSLAEFIKLGKKEAIEHAQRCAAAYAIDAGDSDRAISLIKKYIPQLPLSSKEHNERMILLYLHSAINSKKDLEQSTSLAEKIWEEKPTCTSYHSFTITLAEALLANKQANKALNILKTSLSDLKEGTIEYSELLTFYNKTKLNHEDLSNFNTAVKEWMGLYKPAWYDHVGPVNLDDERIGDINEHLNRNIGQLHTIENNKLTLLMANDPTMPLNTRYTALQNAFIDLIIALESWEKRELALEKFLAVNSKS